jgi:hypothetical protein
MKVALVAVPLIALGCVDSEVTALGPVRPARPEGCDVTLSPGRPPDFPIVDIATASASCDQYADRDGCIGELRRRACAAGADVVYGFSESVSGNYTHIAATFAYRDTRRAKAPPPAATPAAPGDCTPICSPGFACQAGACIPQCNPACEKGETCKRHRTCEPAAPAPPAPAPAHP